MKLLRSMLGLFPFGLRDCFFAVDSVPGVGTLPRLKKWHSEG